MLQRSPHGLNIHAAGRRLRIPPSRRLVLDVLHFSRQVPSIPTVRHCQIAPVVDLRRQTTPRIGWPVLFMKAFGLVAARHRALRQTYMPWPWAHFYEHPVSVARMTVSREYRGERWVFFAQFVEPERLPLIELQMQLDEKKHAPVESIDKFRQQHLFSRFPTPLRRLAWWSTLNVSGPKRIERMGTFGMTTVSSRGAVSVHPPSLYTTMLTFGPVSSEGHVRVTFVYDHRVLDGLEVAECLEELEQALNGPIADELRAML